MSGPGEGGPSPTPDLPLSEQHTRMLLEGSANISRTAGCTSRVMREPLGVSYLTGLPSLMRGRSGLNW